MNRLNKESDAGDVHACFTILLFIETKINWLVLRPPLWAPHFQFLPFSTLIICICASINWSDGNICNRSVITSDGTTTLFLREGEVYSVLHRRHIQISALNDPWTKEATRNNERERAAWRYLCGRGSQPPAICLKNTLLKREWLSFSYVEPWIIQWIWWKVIFIGYRSPCVVERYFRNQGSKLESLYG